MRTPFADLSRTLDPIRAEIDQRIAACIDRAEFTLGRSVEEFEHAFADYCEAGWCIGVDNGTSALELTLRAWGIGTGDEVIVPANTFIATASAVSNTGATPVLVDVVEDTMTICPNSVARAITARTRAIIPVHLYGCPADVDAILEIAQPAGIYVLEDACQAHGARLRGRRVGSIGDAGAFSFSPLANLGGFGDGGAVVTDDPALADEIALLRNYGQEREGTHIRPAYNRRLDALQAAILCAKLPHLDAWNAERRAIAAAFDSMFDTREIGRITPGAWSEPVYHVYPVFRADRETLAEELQKIGIECAIHYPLPIHLQPAYRGLGMQPGHLPRAEKCCREELSLPLFPGMTAEEVDYVTNAVLTYTGHQNLPMAA